MNYHPISRGRFKLRPLLLATCAAAILAAAGPASASAGLKGFWGPSQVNGISQFPVYKRLGVDLYQTAIRWDTVAPTKPADPTDPADPAYQWPAELDYVMSESRAHNMRVLLMIIGAPRWSNGSDDWQWVPRSQDYADFAVAAARRYASVRHWMIWGEPSRTGNFYPVYPQTLGKPLTKKQASAPRRYARMLDAAYAALKSVRRSNLVIGGNTFSGGDIRAVKWVKAMRLPNGQPPRMDLYGHNPFSVRRPNLDNPPGPSEIVDFSDLGRFQKVLDRHFGRNRRKPLRLVLSEWTVPTAPDSEFNYYTTPATQARFIDAGFRVARAVNAYGLGWIHLYDEPLNPDGSPSSHGGLLYSDGREKPGFNAFRRGRL